MPALGLGPASDDPSPGLLATYGGRRLHACAVLGERGGEGARRPAALGGVEMEEGAGEAKSAVSGSSLERSGNRTQRKAAGSAGLTVGAGIATVHDEERSVSWSGQQRGGVENAAAARRKWAHSVQTAARVQSLSIDLIFHIPR